MGTNFCPPRGCFKKIKKIYRRLNVHITVDLTISELNFCRSQLVEHLRGEWLQRRSATTAACTATLSSSSSAIDDEAGISTALSRCWHFGLRRCGIGCNLGLVRCTCGYKPLDGDSVAVLRRRCLRARLFFGDGAGTSTALS